MLEGRARQTVPVRRDQPDLAFDDLEQRAVQRRPRLVRRDRVDRTLDHPLELLRIDRERGIGRHGDARGKLLGPDAEELEAARLAPDIQREILGFQLQFFARELPDELEKLLRGDGERGLGLHVGHRAGRDRKIQVGRRHLQTFARRFHENVREDGKRRSAGNGAGDEAQPLQQLRLRDGALHGHVLCDCHVSKSL